MKRKWIVPGLVGVFLVCFVVAYLFVFVTMSTEEFDACEQIVRKVYQEGQQGKTLFEVPKGYHVSITPTTIKVSRTTFGSVSGAR